jgi:CheY-like chemotaxis protein
MQEGVGTAVFFSLPMEDVARVALGETEDVRRWFSPYQTTVVRTRRSKAPVTPVSSRIVLAENGNALGRLLSRYLPRFEILSVRDLEKAIQEVNHSPARALVINAPPIEEMQTIKKRLGELPCSQPVFTCWVPGEEDATKQLGLVKYLVKPISREILLSTLEEFGGRAKSILLVDDEPEVLRLFVRMLISSNRDYRILQATTGRRALHLMRERQPDLVLLDLIMPEMDGFQVLHEKARDSSIRDIPVMVISSRGPGGDLIVSDTLSVTCNGGVMAGKLVASLSALIEIFSPMNTSSGVPASVADD